MWIIVTIIVIIAVVLIAKASNPSVDQPDRSDNSKLLKLTIENGELTNRAKEYLIEKNIDGIEAILIDSYSLYVRTSNDSFPQKLRFEAGMLEFELTCFSEVISDFLKSNGYDFSILPIYSATNENGADIIDSYEYNAFFGKHYIKPENRTINDNYYQKKYQNKLMCYLMTKSGVQLKIRSNW